jgi:phage/plasmid-associated DNA primase
MNNNMDGGSLRRIRIIEFNSRFCDSPKKPNEFLIDPSIKRKTQIWRPYFMSIMIHWYNVYQEEFKNTGKIDTPKEVTQATDKYKNDNDKFNDFFDECVEDSNIIVHMKDIYRLFSVWWVNNNINNYKMPDSKELIRAMKLKYNEDDYTLYKGFRVKININDNDNVVEEIDELM